MAGLMALVQEIPATVGLLVPADQSSYAHSETRAGVVWSVALGQGQQAVAREVLDSLFREVREFSELEAARKSEGLQAIFEPRIEQYSFATAQETGRRLRRGDDPLSRQCARARWRSVRQLDADGLWHEPQRRGVHHHAEQRDEHGCGLTRWY